MLLATSASTVKVVYKSEAKVSRKEQVDHLKVILFLLLILLDERLEEA